MTAKRFTHKKWYDERQLFDGEEAFAIVDTGIQASIICDKLNKLSDENEQLKQQLKKNKLNEAIQTIDKTITTHEEYEAWNTIYKKLTGKPLGYVLR